MKMIDKDYNLFLERMGSFDMVMGEMEEVKEDPKEDPKEERVKEIIQHYGVKGMKWGVRRFQPYRTDDGQKGKGKLVGKAANRAKESVSSVKREFEAKSLGSNTKLKSLSNEQLVSITNRLRTENDLKRLSTASGDKGDKSDYRRRGQMSDAELKKRVERLQLEDNLRQQSKRAVKHHVQFAEKVFEGALDATLEEYGSGVNPTVLTAVKGAIHGATPKTIPNKYDDKIQKAHKQRMKNI